MDFYLERDFFDLACSIIMMVSDKAQHMLEIGAWEYKACQTYCTYLRLRRKTELDPIRKKRSELKDRSGRQAEDSMHILRKIKGACG